jgi:hypothetical protein
MGAVGRVGEVKRCARSASSSCSVSGQRIENRCRDPADRAPFQLRVVLNTDPCQRRDPTVAQSEHPPGSSNRQTGLLGSDLGSSRRLELADPGSIAHTSTV